MEESRQKNATAVSVKMLATVALNDGCLSGELSCKYFDKPCAFNSLIGMIDIMETTFDTKGIPEQQLLLRRFGKASPRIRKNELDLSTYFGKNATDKADGVYGNKVCKFDISVKFRHNAEWQGTIRLIDEKETERFSSIVELLRIMDKALSFS